MKKLIVILLIFTCVAVLSSCGKNQEDDGKALETAETYVQVTGNSGSLSLNEDVAITLLEIYDKELLGLSEEIYEYELKLSATRFMEKDACLVEAFLEGAEKPEGTYIILGQQCFVYMPKTQKYFLLTPNGIEEYVSEIESDKSQEGNSTTEPSFVYDEENNIKLHDKFSFYSNKKLGIKKDLEEYVLVATGTTTTAENGETVYVIRIYEKTGEATNKTLAFNENGNYVFDYDINKYVKL